jgi:hypothetical protein
MSIHSDKSKSGGEEGSQKGIAKRNSVKSNNSNT